MPSVITGYEPTGSEWSFVDERVVSRAQPGTRVVSGYQDSTVLSVAGWDLWGNVTIDDIVRLVTQNGGECYYVSRFRNPPGFVGFDTYRLCYVGSP